MDYANELGERMPPNSKEAEEAVLGSLLRNPAIVNELVAMLRTSDFYQWAGQRIWEAVLELHTHQVPIDLLTIGQVLEKRKTQTGNTILREVGGPPYLLRLWEGAPCIGNGEYYGQIVREFASRRDLIHMSHEIAKQAWHPGTKSEEVIKNAEQMIFEISKRSYLGAVFSMAQTVEESLEVLDRRSGLAKDGEIEDALMSGWEDLDKLTAGLRKRELVVVAARPSVGKTLFGMNLITNTAATGKRVFFASLEQGRTELVLRTLCRRAGVNSYAIRRGIISNEDRVAIMDAANEIKPYGVWFDDGGNQSAARILSVSRRLATKDGLDLVAVDYLQLLEPENPYMRDYEAIGRNCLRLKQLAKELDIPVLLLCQLNRQLENRQNKTPQLADLRGSGEIEQHADAVLMLHKPEPPSDQRENDLLEVLVRKQRNGPLGEVTLVHRKRFFDICNYQTPPPVTPPVPPASPKDHQRIF